MNISENKKSTLSDDKKFLVPNMGKTIIVTEKPSVARTFASVLGVKGESGQDGYIENDKYVITWCVGHLVSMSYPNVYGPEWEKWSLEKLPFLPESFLYEIINDVKKQFNVVKKIYNRKDVDTLLYAGDPAREGIYIQMLVKQEAGLASGVTERVVWIDSQTEEEIKRGIREAKPLSEYNKLIDAGYARAIEDYIIGMNFSRALSCKYGKGISVGRVMTCVLGMIVSREREIRNFKVTPFYKIAALGKDPAFKAGWDANKSPKFKESPLIYDGKGFKEEKDAKEFISSLGSSLLLKKKEIKENKKFAPNLFNLAELQSECTKKFKIGPDKALEIAQSLYEKKMTTYPRTDARVLSSAIAKVIENNIKGLKKYSDEIDGVCSDILSSGTYKNIANTKYTDDSKVTDHYAIIPTGENVTTTLSDIEKKVYDLIVRRFLSIFMDPAVYEKTDCKFDVDGEPFSASSSRLIKAGYLSLVGKSDDDESGDNGPLDKLVEGQAYNVDYTIEKGETQPPKRYTSGSMILAMENAGNLIEEEELRAQIKSCGIGTSATRAGIIKKLCDKEYIKIDKKTQVITPMQEGESIYDIVEMIIPDLLKPNMTASWEKGLSQIETGECTQDVFLNKLYDYIRKTIQNIKELNGGNNFFEEFKPEYIEGVSCPACGGRIRSFKNGSYGCENFKKEGIDCNIFFGKAAGHVITKKEIIDLITAGETKMISGFTSKKGNEFSATLVLKEDEGKFTINFGQFAEREPKVIEYVNGVLCPCCSRPIRKFNKGYGCENFKLEGGCNFYVSNSIAGHELKEKEFVGLVTTGETGYFYDFVSKKGSKFSAKLNLVKEDGQYKAKFVFPADDDEIETSYKCPNCDGVHLKRIKWDYVCKKCGFKIATSMARHQFTPKEITTLLEKGKTANIKGFCSKEGKSFEAIVVRDNEGKLSFDFSKSGSKKKK